MRAAQQLAGMPEAGLLNVFADRIAGLLAEELVQVCWMYVQLASNGERRPLAGIAALDYVERMRHMS